MICPKCGFDQPDDAYCAFCGISIRKYRQERRKKQFVLYGAVSFAVVTVIFIAVNAVRRVEAPVSVTPYAEKEGEDQIKGIDLPETGRGRFEAKGESAAWKVTDREGRSASRQEGLLRTERLEDEGPGTMEPSQKPPLAEPTAGSVPETNGGDEPTAREWFERGTALDDESESEVEFYQKALELNPEFAPAYYRLGAIHFRRARYELADQEFAKFIEHASEDERQIYDIYVYYSPSDMERLSAAAVTEEASGEEEEKETSAEAAVTEEKVSAEVEGEEKKAPSKAEEAGETPGEAEEGQAETAAPAEETEEETPEEAEEGQAEAAAPAEETEEETPEETEEAETEIPAEVPKEAEEETEY